MKDMRKILVLALALLPFTASADDDRPVRFEQLPAAAQQFIRTHFAGVKITLATADRGFMETTYNVIFTDGTKVEFDSGGEWEEIESRGSFVPAEVVPPRIAEFIDEHFPGARVRDIERDRHGFEVNLDNRRELHFDPRGNFRGYDD